MKSNMKIGFVLALALTATVAMGEQAAGPGRGPRGGKDRPAPPDPAVTASNMMAKFDANQDGKLVAAELTAALTDQFKSRPAPPGDAQQQPPSPPPADKIAAKMIEEFAADKTGLTMAELQKAVARPPHGHGGPGGPDDEGPGGCPGDDDDGGEPPPPPPGE